MKFLIVGEIHHPEELLRAQQAQPPGAESILFPPSQGQYFWVRALRKLGHQVDAFIRNTPALFRFMAPKKSARFSRRVNLAALMNAVGSYAPQFHPDYRVRNRRLLDKVAQYQPDAILLTAGNSVILPETLQRIKTSCGSKIVYLSGVSPIVFSHAIERRATPLYDLVVVNDFYHGIQWLELGAKRMETLPVAACDPEFHHPYQLTEQEQTEYGCSVGFIGTLLPPNLYSSRVEALQAVQDCGLGIWSVHEVPKELERNYRGRGLGEKMLRILCGARIQINPHGNFMRYGGNLRLFEAAGCGVFQITDDLPGTSVWFTPSENIVTYRDPKHLRELVTYYLSHETERCQIAEGARNHVYEHHTYRHRMEALVQML